MAGKLNPGSDQSTKQHPSDSLPPEQPSTWLQKLLCPPRGWDLDVREENRRGGQVCPDLALTAAPGQLELVSDPRRRLVGTV